MEPITLSYQNVYREVGELTGKIDDIEWRTSLIEGVKEKPPVISEGERDTLIKELPKLKEKCISLIKSIDDPIGIKHIKYIIGEERYDKAPTIDFQPNFKKWYGHIEHKLSTVKNDIPCFKGKTADGREFFAFAIRDKKELRHIAIIGQKIINSATWVIVAENIPTTFSGHLLGSEHSGHPDSIFYPILKSIFSGEIVTHGIVTIRLDEEV